LLLIPAAGVNLAVDIKAQLTVMKTRTQAKQLFIILLVCCTGWCFCTKTNPANGSNSGRSTTTQSIAALDFLIKNQGNYQVQLHLPTVLPIPQCIPFIPNMGMLQQASKMILNTSHFFNNNKQQ